MPTCQADQWSPPTDLGLHSKREAYVDPIGYSAVTDSTYPCANDDDISEGMPSFATDASLGCPGTAHGLPLPPG